MSEYGLCTDCYEAITNPICDNCFVIQINHWLRDVGVIPSKRKVVIDNIRKELAKSLESPEEITDCLICGRESVSICSYCFFLSVSKILKQINLDKELTKNFIEVFDYRQGYDSY